MQQLGGDSVRNIDKPGCITVIAMIQVLLIVLKVCGYLRCSWVVVLVPTVISNVIVGALVYLIYKSRRG